MNSLSSMSRESDDNFSSITSTYTDMYQETVKGFTRSSLSPDLDDRFSPSRRSMKSTSAASQKSDGERHASFDLYLEATGRRRSSDHGAVLTTDTEQFIIGQRVWVGGIRPGQIAYIGETHFAPGDWAGIVLDEPNGKNDGCVSGKRYFQCEPKRGIFSRLTRLTLAPMPGACTSPSTSKNSPERSRTVSPTASVRSSFMRSPGAKNGLTVGDRIIVSSGFGSRPGILRYLGETQFASGNWCGVELDEGTGKNDGSVDGIKYFECKPKFGVFVPIAKVTLSPSSMKTRLSRTGSRESLTSIGTMNSIATTNTSRLRMSAQRKSPSIKPVTSPSLKSQFSMQDLLREKQNHIEQLMIERDLDREDTQNQALNFQKNITELKARVVKLERALDDERKKSEDLQFSIDEATFCGDELKVVQNQAYQDKIQHLEKKVTELSTGAQAQQAVSLPDTTAAIEAATKAANVQIAALQKQLAEQTTAFNSRLRDIQEEDKRLQEKIQYLQTQNETLQKELVAKDENLEKFSLSQSGLANVAKELALLKEENDKERQQSTVNFTQKLEEKETTIKCLSEELTSIRNSLAAAEGERANKEDECEIMRGECKERDSQLTTMNDELAKLNAELSMQKAQCATLDDMLKAQQQGNVEEKATLDVKNAEIAKLLEEISALQNAKSNVETNLQHTIEQVQQLGEKQSKFEESLKDVTSADQEKLAAMKQLESVMLELKNEVTAANEENTKLKVDLQNTHESITNLKSTEEILRQDVAQKEKSHAATLEELHVTQKSKTDLENTLAQTIKEREELLAEKAKELTHLHEDLSKLMQKTATLEGESSHAVLEMSTKNNQLEAQINQLQSSLKTTEEALTRQRADNTVQASALTEKSTEFKSTITALENTNNVLEKLKQEHENVSTKCKSLEDNLKSGEERCAQHQLELGDLSRKYEALTTKCNGLVEHNESLQSDVLSARTAVSDLQNEIRKLNDELSNGQTNRNELETKFSGERLHFESQIEELQQKLSNANKDYAELKDSLQKSKDEVAKRGDQITAFEEKTIKTELALSDAQRQLENLQNKCDALTSQNESLQNDLITLRSTSTDSNAEMVKLSQVSAAKQKAYDELLDKSNADRSALESQLQASQQRVDSLCSQVETLTDEQKRVSEESFQRFEQLKIEQDKNGKHELELSDLSRKFEILTSQYDALETQNSNLQKELTTVRSASSETNSEFVKLTEELSNKQKTLQEITDKASADRLQLESQMQELTQRLQASQAEVETLRNELQFTGESKTTQASEFEAFKAAQQTKADQELEELRAHETETRKKLIENFEAQLRDSETTKNALDAAITSLQQQIQLLQEELLKSQKEFKAKEEELYSKITVFTTEKDQLNATLQQVQSERKSTITTVQQENIDLRQNLETLILEIREKDVKLQEMTGEVERQKLQQLNTSDDVSKLQTELNATQAALDLAKSEVEHRTKLAEEDRKKIEEFKQLMEALQASKADISATNAELSEALEILESEKCETANIFELFEMESDQNATKLIEKLSGLKQELTDAQTQLITKESKLEELQTLLQKTNDDMQSLQNTLGDSQSTVLEHTTKLNELNQANAELRSLVNEKDALLADREELAQQLTEYKKVIDEMDDSSTQKSTDLVSLQNRVQQVDSEKLAVLEQQKALKIECASWQRKLEVMDLEKTREIVSLQARINEMQSISRLKQNGAGDAGVPPLAQNSEYDSDDPTAQINFLNSIIIDMQKKNETLKAKIEALEALPTDFTKPKAFELLAKRKPAPRLFCDICDEFDKHETEDCPAQASSDREYSPLPRYDDKVEQKERVLPEPRKYCESCEVFGHQVGECDDESF